MDRYRSLGAVLSPSRRQSSQVLPQQLWHCQSPSRRGSDCLMCHDTSPASLPQLKMAPLQAVAGLHRPSGGRTSQPGSDRALDTGGHMRGGAAAAAAAQTAFTHAGPTVNAGPVDPEAGVTPPAAPQPGGMRSAFLNVAASGQVRSVETLLPSHVLATQSRQVHFPRHERHDQGCSSVVCCRSTDQKLVRLQHYRYVQHDCEDDNSRR